MPLMNLRMATIIIGGIEVEIGEGNLTYSEKRPLEYTTNGNEISEVKEADEEALDLSMDFTWKRIADDYNTLIEKINGGGANVSSDATECRPYAVDVQLKYPDSCGAVPTYKTLDFDDFRYETLEHDMQAGQISVSGKCNIKFPAITTV